MNSAHNNLSRFLFLCSLLILGSRLPAQVAAANAAVKAAANDVPTRTVMVDGVAEPVYHRGRGITFPELIYTPEPDFSDEARKRHIEGMVVLSAIVTSKGETTDVRVLNGLGHGLDEKAVEAVRRWKFHPGSKDGKPVSVELKVEVSFRLYHHP
jgi:TonB family protein